MAKLWMALALAVLATPAAHAQSTNNNGARVGKTGYLSNAMTFNK